MAIIDLTIERPALKRVEEYHRSEPTEKETKRQASTTATSAETDTGSETDSHSSGGRSKARRLGTMAFVAGVLGGAFFLFRRRRTLKEMASIEVDAPESGHETDIEA